MNHQEGKWKKLENHILIKKNHVCIYVQIEVPNPSTTFYLNSIVRDLTVFSNKVLSLSGLAWIAWNWVGFKLRTSSALESCTCLLALNLSAFSEVFSAEQKDCDKKDWDPVKTLT